MSKEPADTATKILDVAELLVQARGFNGFSYADVADELGISKAALHYHFPGNAELQAYARLYADVFQDERMCLCGMLAADYATLPDPMRRSVVRFFDDNEVWLAHVLEEGRAAGTLRFTGSAREVARTIVSGLEGAMLVARPYGDTARFRTIADLLIEGLAAESATAPGRRGRGGR